MHRSMEQMQEVSTVELWASEFGIKPEEDGSPRSVLDQV
jgi:hypothetical protein